MAASISQDQWQAIRTSVREIGGRFAGLLRDVRDPGARATTKDPGWSVADTAAHVATVAWLDTALLVPGAETHPVPGVLERIESTGVDGVHALNDFTLEHFPERDPKALADLLGYHIDRILEATEDRDPAETVGWLGGAQVPLAGLLAHLQNELLLHGHDIARAAGDRWSIPPRDAAAFFELFLMGLTRNGPGRLLEGGGRPRERPIAVEFRSPYTTPATMVLRDGRVTVEPPGPAADVRLDFDPAVMTLMMFGRIGKPRALLSGRVRVSGRRPWLLPIFLRTVRVPS